MDWASSDGSDYGNTLSWPLGRGPGLGDRAVEIAQDTYTARFEHLTTPQPSSGAVPARW